MLSWAGHMYSMRSEKCRADKMTCQRDFDGQIVSRRDGTTVEDKGDTKMYLPDERLAVDQQRVRRV